MEIAFFLDSDALDFMDPDRRRDEGAVLRIFDQNIDRILRAASKAYRTGRKRSYLLGSADF
jgi:hypothetical protein